MRNVAYLLTAKVVKIGRPSHFEKILLPFSAFVKFQVALLTPQLTNKQFLYFHCINNICTLTAMKKKLIRIPELASLTHFVGYVKNINCNNSD